MKKEKKETKKKAGRPKKEKEQKVITFTEVKKYLRGLDFNHTVYKSHVLKEAEKNDAPENIINLLLRLNDCYWSYFHELQKSFNDIEQIPKPKEEVKELTPIETLKKELDEQKKICDSKDERLKQIESRWDSILAIGKTIITIPIIIGSYLLWFHSWILIATGGRFGLLDNKKLFLGEKRLSEIIPFTLDVGSGMALAFVMIALAVCLSIGWIFLFICLDEES